VAAATRVTGRLFFKDELYDGEPLPLHDVTVQFWVGHLLFRHVLGEDVTAADGAFAILLERDHHDLTVEMRVVTWEPASPENRAVTAWSGEVTIPRNEEEVDFGSFYVPFWPYRDDFPLPRAAKIDGKMPQEHTWGLSTRQLAVEAKVGFAGLTHLAETGVRLDEGDLDTIQEAFPPNATLRAGHALSRSDAWLGERFLNGHNPCLLARDRDNPEQFRCKIEWGDIPCDSEHDLSDVDASFEVRAGKLLPVRIGLRIRRAGEDGWSQDRSPRQFTPSRPQWEQARRVFRTQYLLAGELDAHLLKAHMRVEQYCVAIHRHLRQNPVAKILLPHLAEVVPTNFGGDTVAWGDMAIICMGTAMKSEFVRQRMVRLSSAMDWKEWHPRKPICSDHLFARTANLYWEVLDEYVSRFMRENEAEIRRWWHEIRFLSRDLVANSLPYVPIPDDPDLVWDDLGELDGSSLPREKYDLAVRAVRPITLREEDPAAEDLKWLKDFCRFVIYHATFYHGWVHDRQWADGGEIRYAVLALRDGSLGEENDLRTVPTRFEATYGLVTLAVGLETRYGYVMRDEEQDVPPLFKEILEKNRTRFTRLGYLLDDALRSRVNI